MVREAFDAWQLQSSQPWRIKRDVDKVLCPAPISFRCSSCPRSCSDSLMHASTHHHATRLSRAAGWRCLLITAATAAVVHQYVPLTWIYDHYLQLSTSAIVFSFLLSAYLYISSFSGDKLLAEGGQTGASHSRITVWCAVCMSTDAFACRCLRPLTARPGADDAIACCCRHRHL